MEGARCRRYQIVEVCTTVCFSARGKVISLSVDSTYQRHKETNRIRVLMRQEKTMKVLTNFFLDPRIHLVPNAGNDKSWVWNCFDFAEGELLETVSSYYLCIILKLCPYCAFRRRLLPLDFPVLK
jgi:hypothetical protein